MPSFDILKEWQFPETFRSQAVESLFTLSEKKAAKRFIGDIHIEEEEWQIGAIVGRSGTGKTTIARDIFRDNYIEKLEYKHATILDDFPEDLKIQEVTQALCDVGFASPPDWLKSYEQLSQGEKMRVDIARVLTLPMDLVVFDEFTSVIDREIAKIASYAIQKAIRRTKKKFIAVTCHYDILDWLQPDWAYTTDTMEFLKKNMSAQESQSIFTKRILDPGKSLGNITI